MKTGLEQDARAVKNFEELRELVIKLATKIDKENKPCECETCDYDASDIEHSFEIIDQKFTNIQDNFSNIINNLNNIVDNLDD